MFLLLPVEIDRSHRMQQRLTRQQTTLREQTRPMRDLLMLLIIIIAVYLNFNPAFADDISAYTAAMGKSVVCRVDNHVHSFICDVPVDNA
jgi:hypothetical protein